MPCPCCCNECATYCCNGEYPKAIGTCCDNVWYAEAGSCCDGVWYAGLAECCDDYEPGEGECCGGTWYTDAGECCGGVWRTVAGDCCGGTWYPEASPCPEGQVFLRWGENNGCCGCVPDTIFDGREDEYVNTADVVGDLCCDSVAGIHLPYDSSGNLVGCYGRCCDDEGCEDTLEGGCQAYGQVWSGGSSCAQGCPAPCCTTNNDNSIECGVTELAACTAAGGLLAADCGSCFGECCHGGVPVGQMTKTACESEDFETAPVGTTGVWMGLGSTAEQGCEPRCLAPYTAECCLQVQSGASGLTLTPPPDYKRQPQWDGPPHFRATVSGTTDSPVLVHGTPFGQEGKRCAINVTFAPCAHQFHIEPLPCGSAFDNLNVSVCWEKAEVTSEQLRFHCCQDITYILGNSGCVTTLLYAGGGCTSNAAIVLGGDAAIDASGTGALVLTTTVVGGASEKTLTLTGTNSNGNTINGISGDGVSVVKEGTGLWRMNAATKQFDGTLTVTQGFLHMSNPAAVNDDTITIGDTSATSSGVAAYLLEQGVSRDAASEIEVLASAGSQAVYLGGANTSGSSTFRGEIRMSRDVTFVAATGGTVDFSNSWAGPTSGSLATRNVTIGAPGYAGTAELFNFGDLETTGTVTIRYGTVVLGFDTNLISSALTLISDGGPVTLDLGGADLSHGNLFFTGSGNLLINTDGVSGELQIDNGGSTATVTVSGTGHQITCDVSIDDNAGFVISGNLEISGDISGAAGMTKSGTGALTISGEITYTGATNVTGGTLTVEQIHDGSPDVSQAVFTSTTLAVAFTTTPVSGATYELLGGATTNSYTGQVTLTGAGGATGTYNSSTSTLTIT